MARNDVYLNINALSPADAVVTGQQDMTAATVPELVLGDTPTFNFLFTDNTNVWPSWAGNASYTLTWALSDAVAGDFAPAATTGNATPITGGWSVILPLNSYDLVGLLNTKRVGQPYPVQNLWQQLRVTDPSGNEVTRAMFWTPVRYRAISDTQNTESASPTGGRFVTVNNVNTLTTPTAAQFYAANPVPTSALGTAANGELLIGNGTGFTKATLTAGSGVSITNGSGSITITATDGDITLDDGTAAAPSLKFTADTDTGIYRPSDNVVGISAGGVSRATFGATSAINGTTIPGSKTLVVTTDKLSALAATTSAELAGVISDETGSGALVFANTPTLVTPNIGAATGTSVNLSGAGTFGGNLTASGTGTHTFGTTNTFTIAPSVVTLTGAAASADLRLSRFSVSFGSDVSYYTGATLDWYHGTRGLADSNFYLFNNGLSTNSIIVSKATDAVTLAGNLTVSGTGSSSIAGNLGVGTTTPTAGQLHIQGNSDAASAPNRPRIAITNQAGTAQTWTIQSWQTSGDANLSIYRTAAAGGILLASTGGRVGVGVTSFSGSGALELATHTTSAGGIGFGSVTSLHASSVSGCLELTAASGTTGGFKLYNTTNQRGQFVYSGTDVYIDASTLTGQLIFRTNGSTTALTLDSSQNATFAGRVTPTGGIVGVTTNSNAAAGNVGEIVTAVVDSGSGVALTSAVVANATSISLTAGDWDVTGVVGYDTSGATVSQFLQGLNNASASLGPTGTLSKVAQSLSGDTNNWYHMVPTYRFSLSATSTVYLLARATFSAGTVSAFGAIRARRVR